MSCSEPRVGDLLRKYTKLSTGAEGFVYVLICDVKKLHNYDVFVVYAQPDFSVPNARRNMSTIMHARDLELYELVGRRD